jgi:hypothetical protein|tara:strand:- start:1013 stop:2026 length:1014 start_codon:yes stop_codon:yes gene_type:complete
MAVDSSLLNNLYNRLGVSSTEVEPTSIPISSPEVPFGDPSISTSEPRSEKSMMERIVQFIPPELRELGRSIGSTGIAQEFKESPVGTTLEFVGPGADVKVMQESSARVLPRLLEGDITGGLSNLGIAAASIPMMAVPGTLAGVQKAITKQEELVPVFPKPERMFPEENRPRGGEYINVKTKENITDQNMKNATLSITPEGKPSFMVNPTVVDIIGSTGKGTGIIRTNLFKKKAGWKWLNAPKEYENIPTLISVEHKGKHYYTIKTDFPEGVNLSRYPNKPSEPKLRPTLKGSITLGDKAGIISVRGKEHPVYNLITAKKEGGSVVERNPYTHNMKAI